MPTRWQEKGVGVSLRRGTSERRRVIDERDGSTAGFETKHWDDHQDAKAIVKPPRIIARRVKR